MVLADCKLLTAQICSRYIPQGGQLFQIHRLGGQKSSRNREEINVKLNGESVSYHAPAVPVDDSHKSVVLLVTLSHPTNWTNCLFPEREPYIWDAHRFAYTLYRFMVTGHSSQTENNASGHF